MLRLCNKNFHSNRLLNVVQRIFCIVRKYVHHTHKTILHHVHKRRHHLPNYIHVFMLILIICLYNLVAFNKAEDITTPIDEVGIVIQNEPQILPNPIEEIISEQPSVEMLPWEVVEWEIATWEIAIWEVMVWEITQWETLISGAQEYFSWMIDSLSWEEIYNISGDIIGEIYIESGAIIPVDLSGTSLLTEPLSVIYPTKNIQVNVSWYVLIDTLNSVVTTWWIYWMTYCSRIAYENISSILKAWIRTRRETNDFVVQGDTDQLLEQGIIDKKILEVSSGDIAKIFSGDLFAISAQIYDVYTTFVVDWERVYHRITFVYTDDPDASGRYVLDTLRGVRTTAPQKLSDYLAYYTDEQDVHRYIGQGYSPSIIKDGFTVYENIAQLFQQIVEEEILTWEIFTWEVATWEQIIFTWDIQTETWAIEITTGEIIIEEVVSENISGENLNIWDEEYIQSTGEIEEISEIIIGDEEEIITWYFTKAYTRGDFSEKIIELQKLLIRVQIYAGMVDGVYSDATMEAIYQYQLVNNILTEKDSVNLRGYLGPSTRKVLNAAYVNYQLDQLEHVAELWLSSCEKEDLKCRKQELQNTLIDKWYILTKKGLVKMLKESLVGSETLDMSEIRWELMMPIVLQSVNELSWQIAEVSMPQWLIFKTADGETFTGELMPPEFIDPEKIQNDIEQEVIAVIDVGSDEHIWFEDGSGNDLYATFRVPAPGMNMGDTIDVNYSEDGENRIYMSSVNVQDIDGEPYAIFEANHFTTFYLWTTTGTFVIDNDATYATWLAVTLNSNVTWATHMRFWNTITERDGTGWITYTWTKSWNLTWIGGDGIKRVYAQFSGNGVVRNVSDSIIYDTSTWSMASWLQAHLDGSTWWTRFYNLSSRNLYFTGYGNARTTTVSWEDMIFVDGNGDYIQNDSGIITGYPFTISAWIKSSRMNVNQTIVMFGPNNATSPWFGIDLTNGWKAEARSNNRAAVSSTTLVANRRYHIVGIFTGNSNRVVYVDGVQVGSNTQSATLNVSNQQRRIGRRPWTTTTTDYFSGNIDEVRIYNRQLSTTEIWWLYMIPPTFDTQTAFTWTPTLYGEFTPKEYLSGTTVVISGYMINTMSDGPGRWKTVPFTTGLANGTYNVTINYSNVYGKTGTVTYTWGLVVSLPSSTWLRISYSTTWWTSGNVIATLTGMDPTYMIVNNYWSESYIFTGNGSFTYQFVDKQGTIGTLDASVNRIDRTMPTFAGVVSWTTYTGALSGWLYLGNVAITFSDDNLSWAILNGMPYISWTVITWAGNYVFEVSDLAGNTTWATFTVYLETEEIINNQLISSWYTVGSTSLVALDGNYYIWTTNINMAPFTGNLLVATVLQSSNTLWGNSSEVEIPAGAVLENVGATPFVWILNVPVFQTASNYDSAIGTTAISAISVGSTNHIYFKDTWANDLTITYRMPVPGKDDGDLVDVFLSEDGNTFLYHTTVRTILISGQPYVVFEATHMSVAVTAANNGTNLSADKATNSTSGSAYTALSNIVIAEWANGDLAANQTNRTLILTIPTNRKFRAGSGTVSYTAGRDVTAASIAVTTSTITVTFTTDTNANRRDTITISNIYVQAITGNILPSTWNILRTSGNPGTATIAWITNNVTNFWSLSQTFGAHKYLVVTMPGQTYVASSGNSGTATNQTARSGFVIPKITAADQFYNIVTSYAWAKTISYTWPWWTPTYTTGVSFTAGQSTTILNTTLTQAKTGITITVSDGTISWPASSTFTVIDITPPTATVTYVPWSGSVTSGSVVAIVTGFSEPVTGLNATGYTFTWNGSFVFTFLDLAWNTWYATGIVTWIDTTAPTFAWVVSGATYTWNVTITFSDANLSWAILSWLDNSYYSWNFQSGSIVSWTGRYIFTVYDKAGNNTWAIFTIDKTTPTATVTYVPTSGIITTGTVVATLTWFNKTGVTVTNNSWSTSYTFGWNGNFIFNLMDANGLTWSATATVTWIRNRLNYSTLNLYENQVINNWSITGNIVVTLWTGSFSWVVANYVTLTNVPAWLTWVFTLSGTNKLIITLSGTATNHAAINSTWNLIITFLTGAFSWYTPSDMLSSTQTWISVTFYDPNSSNGLTPSDDTMIDADTNPTGVGNCADGKCQRFNYGATNYICASDFWSKNLFRFNLASLPTGAVITSASLRLYRYQINGATDATGFTIKKIINNAGWIEGTRDATTALTWEPNYIQRKRQQEYRYNGSPGMQQGLDYNSTNLISGVGFTWPNNTSYSQEFSFNSNGITVLQARAESWENQGLIMGDIPTTTDHWLCVRSKESTTTGERPLLRLTYYVDATRPSLSSINPVNNEIGVAVNAKLFMYFSENIFATTGYNISIRKLVDWSLVENINAANTGKVTITNNEVKISPTNNFASNTGYYIEVASGAFRDKVGNVYTGFAWSGTWKFTTVDTAQLAVITWNYFTGIYATTGIFGATITSTWSSSVTERGFCRSTIPWFNDCVGTRVSETGTSLGTGLFTLPISWLPAWTRVYFKGITVNSYGMAYTSETGFITRPAQPVIFSPTKIDNHMFVTHWNAVTWASSYKFYLSTNSGFTSYVTWYGPATGITGIDYKVDSGIVYSTTYYYKVVATNSWGDSQESQYTGITTTYYPTPVAWLKFEETAWTIAYDSAEWGFHDGIIFGSPLINQPWVDTGKSFNYDAVNDNTSIVNFNYGSRYTIGFWFKTTSTGDNMHLFSHWGDADTSSINVILDHATQTLRTYVNGNQSLFILGSGVYNELINWSWHYYTISVDNNGVVPGKYRIVVYVDGLYELIDSSLNTSTYTPANNLVLGRVSDGTTGFYKWYIDDFRIFDQVLTTGEIRSQYIQLGDHSLPTANVSYNPGSGSATSGNVIATLTGYSKPITITNNSGSNQYTFTGNGSFTFTYVDDLWQTWATIARVYRINPILWTITWANINQLYTSNIITIAGYGTWITTVSVTSGILYKNWIAVTGNSTTGTDGDQFYIRLLSSGNVLVTVTSTMTIGITSWVFTVITKEVPYIAGPVSFDFGIRDVSDQVYTLERTFSWVSDYFKLIDNVGDNTWYYTTLSMSNMTTVSWDILPYTSIAVKSLTGIVTLSWAVNSRVYSSITGIYQYFTASPLTFIKRDTAANSWLTGTYGLHTIWKIDIPAMQNIGDYTWVITYTLYE